MVSAKRDDQISTRPLLDRLGVRAGMRVSVLGDFTESFLALLRERVGEVADDPAGCDIVFLAAEDRTHLAGAATVAANLRHDAALWIVRPRGNPPSPRARPAPPASRPGWST